MRIVVGIVGCLLAGLGIARGVQPLVAVHDSEFTRTLLTTPATSPTPIAGATGFQWWPTNWAYFVMPESMQEAFRSDGTPFATVKDTDVIAGSLIDGDGTPKYPIVFSLASEAIGDEEIAPFTNYVAAGGFLFVGSSSFTRNTNGTSRGDFAFATQMGIDTLTPGLQNWRPVTNFQKFISHRLVSHVIDGKISWLMPYSTEDIPYGPAPDNINNPSNGINFKHLIWQVTPTTATVIASNDVSPDLLVKQYGKGWFIYYAPMQPLIGHGGEDSSSHAYVIFRKAIEWAFESSKLSIPRLSGWPYPYNAAIEVRHDLEALPGLINQCETSAQYEHSLGLMGDYYPCTGQIRDDYSAPARDAEIASLQRAVTLDGATLGPHNGGLIIPYTPAAPTDYWYWHWAPDEVLSVTIPGYPNGQNYAFISVSNSVQDIRGWLAGITNNARNHWVAPAYNSTREGSKEILDGLFKTAGEEKLTFFPHWTLSTKTSGKHFSFLSVPLSDWYAGSMVSHSMEGGHTMDSIHGLIDFYYKEGGLINQYGHSSSAGGPPPADTPWARNDLMKEYCDYATDTNRYPRLWPVNVENLYDWWTRRSNAVVRPSFATNGLEYRATLSVSNATDPQTAVEFWVPRPGYTNVQVFTNGFATDTNNYRTIGQTIRVLAGTVVTNVEARFTITPDAENDLYSFGAAGPVTVTAPGILTNDAVGFGTSLSAQLVTLPGHGTLSFNANGSFIYTPTNGFVGLDGFIYRATDGLTTSAVATVTLAAVSDTGLQFIDNFTRDSNPAAVLPPWTTSNTWTIADGELRTTNGPTDYGFTYIGASWTNYSVQARLRFPAGPNVPGAAIFGRFDPNTGTRYALWLYPSNTTLGVPNILRLLKFTGWTTWSGIPMGAVNVSTNGFPVVGTNWQTLKLTFNGNQISGSYNGTTLISATDDNFSSVPAYLNGGIGLEAYRIPSGFMLSADDLVVNAVNGSSPVVPQAVNDSYEFLASQASRVDAPGVLLNDVTGSGGGMTAQLIHGPTQHNGAFTLNPDGSFCYTPTNGYIGPDNFTYQVFDGQNISDPATANLTVLAGTNTVFFDNFTRTNEPDILLAPWVTSNMWTVSSGRLLSLSNTLTAQNYAFTIIDTNWTDCSVAAQLSFPDAQSGGGGVGGRLNAATGERYSVWLYGDSSPFGAVHTIELFKWSDWTTHTSLGIVTLPPLGTGPHTLKLSFETNLISAYFDGNLEISVTDNSFASGGVDVETYEDPTHFAMAVDYLLVSIKTGPEIPLYIRNIGVSNSLVTVGWDAVAGKKYRLQYRNALDSSGWTDAPPDVTASAATALQTNVTSGALQRFYRVMIVSP